MIFADPPYNLSNNGVTCYAGKMVCVNKGQWDTSKGFDEDLEFHEKWISECRRILKPQGTIWISGTNHSIYQCGFLLQKLNFHILNDISWFIPNVAPNLACTTFAHSHETLLWAKKDKKAKHIFNYEKMKIGIFSEDLKSASKKFCRFGIAISASHCQRLHFGVIASVKNHFVRSVGVELQNPLASAIHISSRHRDESENKSFQAACGQNAAKNIGYFSDKTVVKVFEHGRNN